MQAGIEFWPDVTNGIIKSVVFGVAVSLIRRCSKGTTPSPRPKACRRRRPAPSRRIARDLALDFILTVFMFRGLGNV